MMSLLSTDEGRENPSGFPLPTESAPARAIDLREGASRPDVPAVNFRSCLVLPLILLAALVSGCTSPPYITSLEEILEEQGVIHEGRYGYPCTAGAHRGASGEHRENTLAALKAADENNTYAFIEFDVQYSKDERIIVFHDKRMFRLYGSLKSIGNATYEELAGITRGEIATYDDVIGVLRKKLNIEIKSQGDRHEDRRLVDEIIADIRKRKREKDILISSISRDVVSYVNETYPHIPTGQIFWLTSSTYLHFDALTKNLYEEIRETKADYLMLHVANLNNIHDLLAFKPWGKTITFWDFDDRMYIVHKDIFDRLWGESLLLSSFKYIRYRLISLFRRPPRYRIRGFTDDPVTLFCGLNLLGSSVRRQPPAPRGG